MADHYTHHLGVSWGTIRDIEKEHLTRHYAKSRLKDVKRIAIDEIAVRKGHKYMTVVLDLDTARVIFVGDGRGGDSLKPFWKRLKRSCATIEAVAADVSPAYIAAVQSAMPDAIFVFDRFHVVKLSPPQQVPNTATGSPGRGSWFNRFAIGRIRRCVPRTLAKRQSPRGPLCPPLVRPRSPNAFKR